VLAASFEIIIAAAGLVSTMDPSKVRLNRQE
jgi:hypothetical protein